MPLTSTGAGVGIGRACAVALAEAGANVVVVDINAETAEATANAVTEFQRRALAGAEADVGNLSGYRPRCPEWRWKHSDALTSLWSIMLA